MSIIHYHLCDKNAYRVSLEENGQRRFLGKIRQLYICHLNTHAWEATDADGSHLFVHQQRWQAAYALKWSYDGRTGNPFPVALHHRKEITEIGVEEPQYA
jgi:hypothetical protein